MGYAEELVLKITGDSQEAQGAVRDLVSHLGGLNDILEDVEKIVTAALTNPMTGAAAAMAVVVTVGTEVAETLLHLAEGAAKDAEAVETLALKTGESVETMSTLGAAFTAAGGSGEQLGNVMFMLGKNLSTTPEALANVKKGLADLHIDESSFFSASRANQILMISDGMRSAAAGTNLAGAAVDLLGRSGRDALPVLLKDISGLKDQSAALGLTWTEQDAKAASAFEQQSSLLSQTLQRQKDQIGMEVLPVFTDLVTMFTKNKEAVGLLREIMLPVLALLETEMLKLQVGLRIVLPLLDLVSPTTAALAHSLENAGTAAGFTADQFKPVASHLNTATDAARAQTVATTLLKQAHTEMGPALRATVQSLLDAGYSASDVEENFTKAGISTANYKLQIDAMGKAHEASAATAKKLKAAQDEVAASLKFVSDAVYDQIVAENKRHLTAEQIAADLKINVVSVKQVLDAEKTLAENRKYFESEYEKGVAAGKHAMEELIKQAEVLAKAVVSNLNITTTAQRETADLIDKRTLSSTDYQIAQVERWRQEAKAKVDTTVGNSKAAYDAIDQQAKEKIDDIVTANLRATVQMQTHNAMLVVSTKGQFQEMLASLTSDFAQLAQISGGSFGGVSKAIGVALGSANSFTKGLGVVERAHFEMGSEGISTWSSIGSIATGVMGMIGPAIQGVEAIWKHFHQTAGRDAVEAFAKEQGGYDALHAKLLDGVTGGEDLWKALTQGVGRNNPEQAKIAIDNITKALDAQKKAEADSVTAAENVGKGFQQATTGILGALKITDDAYAKSYDLQGQIAKLKADMASQDGDQWKASADKLMSLNLQLTDQQRIVETTKVHSQAAADAMSGAFLGAITAEMGAGKSFIDAIRDQSAGVKLLSNQMFDSGLSGSAAFQQINDMVTMASDAVAGPALAAIEGYTQGVIGLSTAGVLTQDEFSGLEDQIGTTATKLEGLGYAHDEVLAAMQGDLQAAWEAQQKYGFSLDATTQALVDEGVQAGLVGEQHKSTSDKMLDLTQRMTDAVEGLAKVFGVDLPKNLQTFVRAGADASSAVTDSLSRIPRRIDIEANVSSNGSGGGDNSDGTPSFASEGYVRGPLHAIIGDWPTGEYVLHKETVDALLGLTAKRGSALPTTPALGPSGDIVIPLSVTVGDHLEQQVIRISRAAHGRGEIPVLASSVVTRGPYA